jgi:hypothetical protein
MFCIYKTFRYTRTFQYVAGPFSICLKPEFFFVTYFLAMFIVVKLEQISLKF